MASISVAGEPTLQNITRAIVRAEAAGFDTVWASGRMDALTQLALASLRTTRVELGTAIVPTYPRHPHALVQQALTVQIACGRKLTLGVGVSHDTSMSSLGFDWSAPVRHAREYLSGLNGLLAGAEVTFDGTDFSLSKATAPLAHLTATPQVLLAALGPQMLRAAGSLADGTILWLSGARYVRTVAVPEIRAAAERAARPAPRVVGGAPVWVTDERAKAYHHAERALQGIGSRPVYRSVLDLDGSSSPAQVALIGDEDLVAERLEELAEAGATDFAAQILASSPEEYDRTHSFLAGCASSHRPVTDR
ncbi:MAG: TIGR03564 family F420-dependent LLM class oxidoreductase [bacterium]|nr:TIGR03564 family F420-dependent LLM class oxidoreductase [bacterium]MDE0437814.1 TIGR03564 family F420-dependent LLM class oxidoreductase [bacterium]